MCVLTWEIDRVAGGHSAHTLPFCLHGLTSCTHIQRTHAHSVTPHPAKPALTVLSHHIWAVLTGDATGQSAATCAQALQLLCPTSPCNFSSPLLPQLPFFSMFRHDIGINEGERHSVFAQTTSQIKKINTQQVHSFKELTTVIIRDMFWIQPSVCFSHQQFSCDNYSVRLLFFSVIYLLFFFVLFTEWGQSHR